MTTRISIIQNLLHAAEKAEIAFHANLHNSDHDATASSDDAVAELFTIQIETLKILIDAIK